ncbi:hypothetical protein [Aquimarina sp. RZ0]|uniref:hypothetical protein n=1 Tax=Aquimarina sp. RZ0 TaxID=2607730 RepID=UPI0011F14E78|nr:hypothetical protein [Aquimarina sp. RZ0]KAA1247917.1 hypothetical protein F0000_01475 [Aquimarina sp. RZ0]
MTRIKGKRKREQEADNEETREVKRPRKSTRDRRPKAEKAKDKKSKEKEEATKIEDSILKIRLLKDRRKEYRKYSIEKNRDIIINFRDTIKRSWADSLSPTERALVREQIENDEDFIEGRIPELRNLNLQIIYSQGNNNDFASSGGVGTPGMSKINISVANAVSALEGVAHIRDKILGNEGVEIRRLLRSGTDVEKKEAREIAIGLIRRIQYPDTHLLKTEGRIKEVHAVGLGNDVLAVRLSGLDEEQRLTAAPYDSIALEIDEIERWDNQLKTRIIAYYAGFQEALPDGVTIEDLNSEDGAKLREFATIQIAEKGRELRRVDEANIVPVGEKGKKEEIEDKRIVEKALETAEIRGFDEVYVNNADELAVFAQKGGQKKLRDVYGITELESMDLT